MSRCLAADPRSAVFMCVLGVRQFTECACLSVCVLGASLSLSFLSLESCLCFCVCSRLFLSSLSVSLESCSANADMYYKALDSFSFSRSPANEHQFVSPGKHGIHRSHPTKHARCLHTHFPPTTTQASFQQPSSAVPCVSTQCWCCTA